MIAICALGWNKAEMTRQWLESVRRNSAGHDVRFYLMDNGSDDHTRDVMQSFGPAYFQRNESNDSLYKGWNTLARRAIDDGADVVILSNNDLIVGPGWLDALARELADPCKRYFLPNGELRDAANFEADARTRLAQPRPSPSTVRADAGWCLVLPRVAVPEFLPIPEDLQLWYGDNWIHWKLAQAGYSCEAVLDSYVLHYGSVTFYSRPGYAEIVARDREIFNRLTGLNL